VTQVLVLQGWPQPAQFVLLSGVHFPVQQYASLPHSASVQHVWQMPPQFFWPGAQHCDGAPRFGPSGSGAWHSLPGAHVFPVPQLQVPPEQCVPEGHALPQVPQLASSLNIESPPGHVQYDVPPLVTHCWPSGHALPQVPQLDGSSSVPEAHLHAPLLQTSPLLHLFPHCPQSLLVAFNVRRSGHTQ